MIAVPKPLFALGQMVATPGALDALTAAGQTPTEFVNRHVRGDWGDVCEDDKQANNDALASGERILSAYRTNLGVKLWVITESDRSSTCILLPDEY
jgi:hypothetical protein